MPDPEVELYGLPLEDFTPARDAAAKELRKAGDRETAARVAKLPKPTPAAWAANQVAREQPELIEALLEAGAGLREAQDAAVAGHGSGGLREATLAQRSAVDAVMAAATALKPAGRPLSRPMADRLRTTLQAAAGDEALRDALSNGRLVNEAQAGGAWPFALEPAPARRPAAEAAPAKPAAGKKRPGESRDEAAAARKAAEREEREAAERAEREQRKQLEAQLRDARMSLRVRERVAAGAAEDAEAAAQAVADADERLEEAKQAAEEARAEAEAAQRVFSEAESELERARDEVARLEERLD
jgi:DNA repair exonuclease SbcCD ATPase subunit